ncbi:hypothetical protein SRDD_15970 [Serratia sp. DD3]|nr:hypothetical protein SRDD_15970 [Serratia sp. DD3]
MLGSHQKRLKKALLVKGTELLLGKIKQPCFVSKFV